VRLERAGARAGAHPAMGDAPGPKPAAADAAAPSAPPPAAAGAGAAAARAPRSPPPVQAAFALPRAAAGANDWLFGCARASAGAAASRPPEDAERCGGAGAGAADPGLGGGVQRVTLPPPPPGLTFSNRLPGLAEGGSEGAGMVETCFSGREF